MPPCSAALDSPLCPPPFWEPPPRRPALSGSSRLFLPSQAARSSFPARCRPAPWPTSLSVLAAEVVGRPVEIGDHVRAGQMLARLDPADLQLSEQASQAALQAAEADAANARADLARYIALGRSSAAYLASQYDRRVSASRMADARLVQAQRQFALAHDQSGYGSLRADADGVITALPVQVGQVVTAGQTVASLAHTDQTEIWVDVPENRLADIRRAGAVTVSLWAAPIRILPPTSAKSAPWPTPPPALLRSNSR